MNIEELTIGAAKEAIERGKSIAEALGASSIKSCETAAPVNNGMVGKYVIVRCRDAGVHAGVLESYSGRECLLNEARRLWYWKPAGGQAFLSGVATHGLDPASKVGNPIRIHLTENCELIECTAVAEASIRGARSHEV